MNVLPLTPQGCGDAQFQLGNVSVELMWRFNYTTLCWVLDVLDASGNLLAAGLCLMPGVNILKPYPDLVTSIGSFTVIEMVPGNYQDPTLLGTQVQLVWTPPA